MTSNPKRSPEIIQGQPKYIPCIMVEPPELMLNSKCLACIKLISKNHYDISSDLISCMIQLLLMDNFPDIQQQLINFIRAFGLTQAERTPCSQPVSVSEAHALMELANDAPFSQQVLGGRLNLEKSTVSRLVKQLEQNNWIKRERGKKDKRMLLLSLSPKGTEVAACVQAAREKKFSDLLANIPKDKHNLVSEALTLLSMASLKNNQTKGV